jgi:hypothetical protein
MCTPSKLGMAAISRPSITEEPGGVEKAVAKGQPWIEPFARFGYIAKGFVYLLVGGLTVLAATNIHVGQRGSELNQRGVLDFLARKTFGSILLLALAAGLAGYALWRFISAIVNAEEKGPLKRIAYAFSGMAYAYLGYLAILVVLGARANSDDKGVARTLIDKPFGPALLVAVGLVIFGVAIGQLWIAVSGTFKSIFKMHEMKHWQRVAAMWLGRIGISARAVLFGLIGGFFVAAGIQSDARPAGGVTKALATIQHTVFGNWLLGAVCVGLVCYALFMFFEARFRRIRLADPQVVAEVAEQT